MAHFGNDGFKIHGDDRLVFDDHDRARCAVDHFAAGNGDKLFGLDLFHTNDRGDIRKGEPFEGVQQQCLAAVVGQLCEMLLGFGFQATFAVINRRTGA